MTERAGTMASLTLQLNTPTTSGFEKFTPGWATDATKGASGTVTGSLLDAGAAERERAQARGEVVEKVLVTPYPVGLTADAHRFVTGGGTKYRVAEVQESTRRGRYALVLDTT